jgi:hypothetical protein
MVKNLQIFIHRKLYIFNNLNFENYRLIRDSIFVHAPNFLKKSTVIAQEPY